ncbi:MAG: MarC family protein [Tepidisphaeraceae bacterium]
MNMHFTHEFFETFIPLFVAIDAFGLIPIFIAVTDGMTPDQRKRVTFLAVGAATIISIAFMFFGNKTFAFIGINTADFRVAGGIVLLVLAIMDLLLPGKPAVNQAQIVGIVPLAMPLIAGPATLTTTIVLSGRFGYTTVFVALLANYGILLACLLGSGFIAKHVGKPVLLAVSKLVMLLLAAIAVHFIHTGITQMIHDARLGS